MNGALVPEWGPGLEPVGGALMSLKTLHVDIEISDDFVDWTHPNFEEVEAGKLIVKEITVRVINLRGPSKSSTQSLSGIVIDPQSPSDASYLADTQARLLDDAINDVLCSG